jgi:putative ABC transport system substrate-binding protein
MNLAIIAGVAFALAGALSAYAQPAAKLHRVGMVFTITPMTDVSGPDPVNPAMRAFLHGLRDLGYAEGRNLILERRSLEGEPDRIDQIVRDFVRLKADVIFIPHSPMLPRVRGLAATIPIVAFIDTDLVGTALVESFARPGGNITGLSTFREDVEAKGLELLREIVPGASRLAYVGTRQEWERPSLDHLRAAARRLGVAIFHAEITPPDLAFGFKRARIQEAQMLIVERSTYAFGRRREIGELAVASGVPTLCAYSEMVAHGCLMSYGAEVSDLMRRSAGYVDKILKGAKPGELPIEQPVKLELVINLRTAKVLGVAMSSSMLLRADRVIE